MKIAWDYDMSTKDQKDKTDNQRERTASSRSVSRRALLKGTATAMPAILTLQSGAALARSSNLISAASSDTRDRLGRALCLDTRSVDSAGGSGDVFDLGPTPSAHITAINEREWHVEANRGSDEIDETALCERGGPAFYRDHGWHEENVPPGVIVSATALMSFATSISITEV